MPLEDLDDEIRMEVDDGLKEELVEQFQEALDETLSRMEDAGIDIDELDL